MNKKTALIAALVLPLGLALPGLGQADPPWKTPPGHAHKHENRHEGRHAAFSGGPPPWAPAHGYRRGRGEDREAYVSHSREFGIPSGTCNREALGGVLGGVVGGVIGSEIGRKHDEQAVGAVAGTVIGVIVGRSIGRQMDDTDRQCTGQVLERAPDHLTVRWRNPQNGLEFEVTPTRTFEDGARYCRDYVTRSLRSGTSTSTRAVACRNPDGSWQRVDSLARR